MPRSSDPRSADAPLALTSRARLDPAAGRFDASRALGVYVHFPFCAVHCPYCDFAVDVRKAIPHDAYADAVVAEIAARAPWFRDAETPAAIAASRFRSIYFGGGTPGLWRPDALGRVVQAVQANFALSAAQLAAAEITVEINPSAVDGMHLRTHLEALRAAGVNRLSLGAQSFDDAELIRLGRDHDAAAIPRMFVAARAAGFSNLTVDLMFGVPGQTQESWQAAVAAVVALAPEHVSAYSLTVEKGTRYFNEERQGRLQRPDDDATTDMFRWGRAALAAAGYQQYEVSSHARPGHRAVHNQLYWTQGAYLGVGASAASFRPLCDGSGFRFTNPRATDTYLRAAAVPPGPLPAKVERRSGKDLENEALWLALRTADGVDRAGHTQRFGVDPLGSPERQRAADACARAGWLLVNEGSVRLSEVGFLFADEVAARLWGD